jgi:inorganic pyrophosphatase
MSFPSAFFRWRPHPWHGLEPGENPPHLVSAYIEITPFDTVKYEVDKKTGYLRVDRPQRTTASPPNLYGFIPRTYCGERVADLSPNAREGDGDPLDICVISERPINRSDVILSARVIGGLQMVDQGQADDKILAILDNDNIWTDVHDIKDLPQVTVERLHHYFSTYKQIFGEEMDVEITSVYGAEQAKIVVQASLDDYEEVYGG